MAHRICVIGTGLIGCSFSLALKQAGFSGHIVGCARTQATLDEATARGFIDSGSTDPAIAAAGADIVMLTVPMLAAKSILLQIRDVIGAKTIVTDGGSVKSCYVAEARTILRSVEYLVPGHPIAGRELSGVGAAQADLFNKKLVLLTPIAETDPAAVATVAQLWEMTGAVVEQISPQVHDRVLAATSHLPHVLAFGLVDTLATMQEHEEIFRYAAGGFRDFTRIASSDPVMWRDICLSNQQEISAALGLLLDNLTCLRRTIDNGDADELHAVFSRASKARGQAMTNVESRKPQENTDCTND